MNVGAAPVFGADDSMGLFLEGDRNDANVCTDVDGVVNNYTAVVTIRREFTDGVREPRWRPPSSRCL